jgi:hypothetical protein
MTSGLYNVLILWHIYTNITCDYDDILRVSRAAILLYIHEHQLWWRWHLLCITCCHCAIYVHKHHLWLRWYLVCITCCHCALYIYQLLITLTSGEYHVLPLCHIYIKITCDYDDNWCVSRAAILLYTHKHHLWLRWHLVCITCCHCAIYT